MKDPAVLLYYDKYIASTNGMRADFRGWFLDLILYQYDKGPIPTDFDTLAGICRVRPDELNNFNQMVNQVVNQKFQETPEGLVNQMVNQVVRKREKFVNKRTKSSNIGVLIKRAMSLSGVTDEGINNLRTFLFNKSLDEIISYKTPENFNHLVNHLVNLYINVNVNSINSIVINNLKKENKKEKNEQLKTDDEFVLFVCDVFDQNLEVLQMRVWSFMNSLLTEGKFQEFKDQTNAYIEFKKITKQTFHRWISYQSEWNLEDWISKLQKVKENESGKNDESAGKFTKYN
jgi:hypothetical protein